MNFSSNTNEVISAVLNPLLFFYEKILHAQKPQKAPKAQKNTKSTKSTKTQPSKCTKRYKWTKIKNALKNI